jgi:hypothetical protein
VVTTLDDNQGLGTAFSRGKFTNIFVLDLPGVDKAEFDSFLQGSTSDTGPYRSKKINVTALIAQLTTSQKDTMNGSLQVMMSGLVEKQKLLTSVDNVRNTSVDNGVVHGRNP